jgi:hypothetical protein
MQQLPNVLDRLPLGARSLDAVLIASSSWLESISSIKREMLCWSATSRAFKHANASAISISWTGPKFCFQPGLIVPGHILYYLWRFSVVTIFPAAKYFQRTSGSLPPWKCRFAGQTSPSICGRRRETMSPSLIHSTGQSRPNVTRTAGISKVIRHLDQHTTIRTFFCVYSLHV